MMSKFPLKIFYNRKWTAINEIMLKIPRMSTLCPFYLRKLTINAALSRLLRISCSFAASGCHNGIHEEFFATEIISSLEEFWLDSAIKRFVNVPPR